MNDVSIHVENLSVGFESPYGRKVVVRNASFTLRRGHVVALVGESGSGKSVIARSLVGLTGAGAVVQADRLALGERDLRTASPQEWESLRGRDVGFVLQDALVSLDPLRRIGREVGEALDVHKWGNRTSRWQRIIETLERSGIPEPAFRARQRSGELSGGLRQRALIASALVLNPPLLIADEPTTALDPSVKAQILRLLIQLKTENTGLLIISHDLGFVSHIADEIVVLRHGEVVEQGDANQILYSPRHPYTRKLLDAVPSHVTKKVSLTTPKHDGLIQVERVSKSFRTQDHTTRKVLHDVSFTIHEGEAVGLIGESGSGKSTLARIIMGFTAPDSGSVRFDGHPWNAGGSHVVREKDRRTMRPDIGMIYQDPLGSFDPRWTVQKILEDAIRVGARTGTVDSVAELLSKVHLPASTLHARPLTLSGGQRQRVAIARAIATRPRLIVCDEPVSALDVSVQAQILDLLSAIQKDLRIALLFISHDMAVVSQVCDRVLVMQNGAIVESGDTKDVLVHPQTEFTQSLLDAANLMTIGAYASSGR